MLLSYLFLSSAVAAGVVLHKGLDNFVKPIRYTCFVILILSIPAAAVAWFIYASASKKPHYISSGWVCIKAHVIKNFKML